MNYMSQKQQNAMVEVNNSHSALEVTRQQISFCLAQCSTPESTSMEKYEPA